MPTSARGRTSRTSLPSSTACPPRRRTGCDSSRTPCGPDTRWTRSPPPHRSIRGSWIRSPRSSRRALRCREGMSMASRPRICGRRSGWGCPTRGSPCSPRARRPRCGLGGCRSGSCPSSRPSTPAPGVPGPHAVPLLHLRGGDGGAPAERPRVVIVGAGPNRIGQGIEFDYACVHAAFALEEAGFESVMVNSNPETVSTDYDTSAPCTSSRCRPRTCSPCARPSGPIGVIVQLGGQTPLRLAPHVGAGGLPGARDAARGDRPRGGPREVRASCCTSSRSPRRRTGRLAPSRRRARSPRGSDTRWSCGRATSSAAARWRSCTARTSSSAS